MKAEVREALGKAAFEVWNQEGKGSPGWENMPEWKDMPDEARAYFYSIAEAVVRELVQRVAIPVLHILLTEEEVSQLFMEQL